MNQRLLTKNQKTTILNILRETAQTNLWQQSNFLRSIGKRFLTLYDHFKISLGLSEIEKKSPLTTTSTAISTTTCVYISLYSIQGKDIKAWEKILANLPGQLPSRPIYLEDKNVIACIKTKPNPVNEAYISTLISNNTICHSNAAVTPKDKLGHPLVTLTGYPLGKNYTAHFYHTSGEYEYKDGKLIRLSDNAPLSPLQL